MSSPPDGGRQVVHGAAGAPGGHRAQRRRVSPTAYRRSFRTA
ncbi:hypothetical protein [Kineococcus sp. NUM-3379]